ncbi:pyridoxamine 5'-phosphate oxidase [Chitinophaga pinensis]|uniref:Pyridoxine/pyridoxamine 5'-phosphate oxidase n=1 Tax=Chitinophaga pinensis (strain ATCC 43595 / DSM 2588 / LMG 13176 / NBRC 15968 / NCIMB 11800 / UQM 2034) TaxID=485918 RepID=A0A979GQT5_CHIPD|nr:pyridoxamine 5'-phosphate oxidase [Chitinophaga pinensis]ACU58384.1 pyridoxamine 5'-phosphate oxidase [Chitinophaga pinensis DSM 2588]
MLNKEVADLRKDYRLASLDEQDVAQDPIQQFERWWKDATTGQLDEPNAMTLATSTPDGYPSARIVLLKSFDEEGFVFFTNYDSHKAQDMAANPNVSLLFFWRELERQVRIYGTVSKTTAEISDEYYESRPLGSRVGAIASPQSRVIPGRSFLEENVRMVAERYVLEDPKRPAYWGGYVVKPVKMEFWQGRSSRLHDRILYTKEGENWLIDRLAP